MPVLETATRTERIGSILIQLGFFGNQYVLLFQYITRIQRNLPAIEIFHFLCVMLPNMEAKQPFSDQDWQATPEPVRQYIMDLEQTIAMLVNKVKQLEKRTEKLESKTNQNSQNSSKPPSSDSPFKKPKKTRKKSKRKKEQA